MNLCNVSVTCHYISLHIITLIPIFENSQEFNKKRKHTLTLTLTCLKHCALYCVSYTHCRDEHAEFSTKPRVKVMQFVQIGFSGNLTTFELEVKSDARKLLT